MRTKKETDGITMMNNSYYVNRELTDFWNSNNLERWKSALNCYWDALKLDTIPLEKRMENLDSEKIKNMDVEEFYKFLYNEYFVWRYPAKNRLGSTRKQLRRYIEEDRLSELETIHKEIFNFDVSDTKKGLEIATKILGLGSSGASGLLSLLFPKCYGSVDQFVVHALGKVETLAERNEVRYINPDRIRIIDGVLLIKIMKDKANALNRANSTDFWTPRKIDQVLWAFGK